MVACKGMSRGTAGKEVRLRTWEVEGPSRAGLLRKCDISH